MAEVNDEQMQAVAAQLRKPHGEYANEVARKMNEANAHLHESVIAALQLKSRDFAVEVGMGNGYHVPQLMAMGESIRYAGYDYSQEMVSAARQLNESYVRDGQAAFFLSAADALPLRDGEADTLFTINTIYFWEDLKATLTEFRRVLKKNGRLVIGMRPKRTMVAYPFTRFGFNMYSREDVVALVTDAGFQVIDVIEKEEPGQEVNGSRIVVESLIIVGTNGKQ